MVSFLFGLSAIIPGNVLEPDKLMLKKAPVSACASMISSTGITDPLMLTWSGLETKARNLYPLPVFFEELLLERGGQSGQAFLQRFQGLLLFPQILFIFIPFGS